MGGSVEEGDTLLDSISEFCRQRGIAESTFGRRAVNDGKFVSRLRDGGRVTQQTFDRIQDFMARHGAVTQVSPHELLSLISPTAPVPRVGHQVAAGEPPDASFRFFNNRQKYLLFVSTCSEKQVIADRVGMELSNIHQQPPAVRVFDAGMGDATVLTRVMREMHRRFPTLPFYFVGKEISLEDVRLSLDKDDGRPVSRTPRYGPCGDQYVL